MPKGNLPREGSALHGFTKGSREERKRYLSRWKLINKIVVPLYQVGLIPALGIGGVILLLKTRGRRSGTIRTTPLEYRRKGGSLYIFAGRGRKADWYKNMMAAQDAVTVRVGFSEYRPAIRVLENPNEKEALLRWYVTQFPRAASYLFGWDRNKDDPETTDISALVTIIEIVELKKIVDVGKGLKPESSRTPAF